jgi:hypothetical protein
LLGVEIEGDPPGRMEVEGDALMAFETDNSNKCQCPPPIVESTTAVGDSNVGTDFAVMDILVVDDNTNVCKDQVHEDALAVGDVHILADRVDDDQVDEDVLAVDDVDILADRVDDDQDFEATTAPVDGDQVKEEPFTAVNHEQADNVNAPTATAVDDPVDGDQVKEELSIEPPKPSKPIQTCPKTSNKFGRGKRSGGNRKTTLTIDMILPNPQAADVGGVAHHRPPAIAKKSTKNQLIRSLNKSEKKRQMTEDKMVIVTKKLHTAANDCKALAVLAQE